MSTPLHVFLKADPSIEGDVANDKADPSGCLLFCSSFGGRIAPWTTNMCFDKLDFLEKLCHICYTVLANRVGWRMVGDLVPWELLDYILGLCVYLQ